MNVPETIIPGTAFPGQFWNWPSGYQDIHISVSVGQAHCLLLAYEVGGTYIFPISSSVDVSLNGVDCGSMAGVSTGSSLPGGGFWIFTDDLRPFQPPLSLPTLFNIPTIFSFISPELQPPSTVTITQVPTAAFNITAGTNSLTLTPTAFTATGGQSFVYVFGLYRFKRFISHNWSLETIDETSFPNTPPFTDLTAFLPGHAYARAPQVAPPFVPGTTLPGTLVFPVL